MTPADQGPLEGPSIIVPPANPSNAQLWTKMTVVELQLGKLEAQLTQLVAVIAGGLDGKAAVLPRLDDLAARVTKLEAALEAAGERWSGRAWAAAFDLTKLVLAAGVGAAAARLLH